MDTIINNNEYIQLQFNDNNTIKISKESIIYINSNLLSSCDETMTIPIIYNSSYILDKNKKCYFHDNTDLTFMFKLSYNDFLNMCTFLDFIVYENKDNTFSKLFIIYVMNNINILKGNINNILFFMKNEIRCIINYVDNIDLDIQIRVCLPIFYDLYLIEYKDKNALCLSIIKNDRYDLYKIDKNIHKYYPYVHKYDNSITNEIKITIKYLEYVSSLNMLLYNTINESDNLDEVIRLIDIGARVNRFCDHENYNYNNLGILPLHTACEKGHLEVVKYLCGHPDINMNDKNEYHNTALYIACISNHFDTFKYLYEHTDIDIRRNSCKYVLFIPCIIEIFKYLCENTININNLVDSAGNTVLHQLVMNYSFIKTYDLNKIKILCEYTSIDVNIQNKSGETAIYIACKREHKDPDVYLEIVQFLCEYKNADINIPAGSFGNLPILEASYMFSKKILIYLCQHKDTDIHIKNYYKELSTKYRNKVDYFYKDLCDYIAKHKNHAYTDNKYSNNNVCLNNLIFSVSVNKAYAYNENTNEYTIEENNEENNKEINNEIFNWNIN